MRYFVLALETGDALSDEGLSVAWATCPDLPGAYEEAPTADEALQKLRDLAHHIIAEHIVREDPLDPAIIDTNMLPPSTPDPDTLTIAITDEEIEAVRALPLLTIEQPEP